MKRKPWLPSILGSLCALSAVWPSGASARPLDVPNLWEARFSTFQGDLGCKYGDPDCNRCVYDVRKQFEAITQRGLTLEAVRSWHQDPRKNYEPSQREPANMTTLTPIDGGHFQSFVRAPTDGLGYAPTLFASYGGPQGGVFAIGASAKPNGQVNDGELLYTYTTQSDHAGGMQAIGERLLVAHYDGNKLPVLPQTGPAAALQILDIKHMPSTPTGELVYFSMFSGSKNQIANVAAEKLAGGGYMVLATPTSSKNAYRLLYTPTLDHMQLEDMQTDDVKASWAPSTGGFENISIINECGTGKTFVIGATANEFFDKKTFDVSTYAFDSSTWALYELVPGTPSLRFVARNTRSMFSKECDPRASGTAFAASGGHLALYCHQKGRDDTARSSGIKCALGVAGTLLSFGFAAPALAYCIDTWKINEEVLFKEYMADVATPEAAPPSYVPVTIALAHDPQYGDRLGVISGTGQLCEVRAGQATKQCTWYVPAKTALKLMPFGGPAEEWIQWQSKNCPAKPDGSANMCSHTITSATTFSLSSATIL